MVGQLAHHFGFSFKEITEELSFKQCILLSLSTPRYKSKTKELPKPKTHLASLFPMGEIVEKKPKE